MFISSCNRASTAVSIRATTGAQVRLDEYALRVTPWDDGRFNLQVGKFSTVVGNWVQRHHSWENPFITAPLPYENLTAISDTVGAIIGGVFCIPARA